MLRFVLFLLLLVPLVALGNWLIAHPGTIDITWLGYEISLAVPAAVMALMLVILLASIVMLFLWHIATWPERRQARRRFRTLSKGLMQLTEAVTALALGDDKAAQRALKKATHLLPGEPLPSLLSAQLLQRQGQHEAARQELRSLMKHETTATLASRRLIEQHLHEKAWGQALALVEKMREDDKEDRWLALTAIDLYSRRGDTAQILALTEGWKFRSPLTREERHRYAALAYYALAQGKEDMSAKRTALRHAVGYAPDFLPAVIAYADTLMNDDSHSNARKLLRDAWANKPDALLIPSILHALQNESPRAQARLIKAFLKGEKNAPHYQLEAQYLLGIHELKNAEDALQKALELETTQPVYAALAEIQKRLHGEETANRTLARAMQAPSGASWICHSCGGSHAQWQPHCEQCNAFDTLRHEAPEMRITRIE